MASDEAVELLASLEEQLDLTQIAVKLIGIMIGKRKVRGPESIGVRGPRLKSILHGGNDSNVGASRSQKRFGGKPFFKRRGR